MVASWVEEGEHLDSELETSATIHWMRLVLQYPVHLTSRRFGNGLNLEGGEIASIFV